MMKKIIIVTLSSLFVFSTAKSSENFRDYLPPNFESFTEGQCQALSVFEAQEEYFLRLHHDIEQKNRISRNASIIKNVDSFYGVIQQILSFLHSVNKTTMRWVNFVKVSDEFNHYKCCGWEFICNIQKLDSSSPIHEILSEEFNVLACQLFEKVEDFQIIKMSIETILKNEMRIRKLIEDKMLI